jgi:hypothetical protein
MVVFMYIYMPALEEVHGSTWMSYLGWTPRDVMSWGKVRGV